MDEKINKPSLTLLKLLKISKFVDKRRDYINGYE